MEEPQFENLLKCPICAEAQNCDFPAFEIHVNRCLDATISNTLEPEFNTKDQEEVENNSDLVKQESNRRSCPSHKLIPKTSFSVDSFSYGPLPNVTSYFLTHFHSDHYMGLSKKFDYGKIYCSPVTAELVKLQIGVDPKYIHPVAIECKTEIEGVNVTFIDANHCCGAVIILFEVPKYSLIDTRPVVSDDVSRNNCWRYLHTGDFRATPAICSHTCLTTTQADGKPVPLHLDAVYLDTTYCNPSHTFPLQSDVVNVVCDLVEAVVIDKNTIQALLSRNTTLNGFVSRSVLGNSHGNTLLKWFTKQSTGSSRKDTLVVVGSYSIGKERIYIAIANRIKSMVYSDSNRRRVWSCLQNPELDRLVTTKPEEANVHVVPMNQLKKDNLSEMLAKYKGRFSNIIAIRPTGWTFMPSNAGSSKDAAKFSFRSIRPTYMSHNIVSIAVPYSEHSSYDELEMFVKSVNATDFIPTVNVERKEKIMIHINKWKDEIR